MRSGVAAAAFLALAVVLAACATIPPAPVADDLQMPATAFPGITEVRNRAFVEDHPTDGAEAVTPESTALRRAGLTSAAQYRYVLGGEQPALFKVRVDVFRDEATAAAQFRGRHLPQALAMTGPLEAGDDGFIYEDLYAGFRVREVTVEIRADGPNGRLADFARTYAGFVTSRLKKTAKSNTR